MNEKTMVSEIKDINSVIAGLIYASNGINPTSKYIDNEEFMLGYNSSLRLNKYNLSKGFGKKKCK